jgi:hypothetical protein
LKDSGAMPPVIAISACRNFRPPTASGIQEGMIFDVAVMTDKPDRKLLPEIPNVEQARMVAARNPLIVGGN